MLLTSLLMFIAMREVWGWTLPLSIAVASLFVVVDLSFVAANMMKVLEGGWVPLVVGRNQRDQVFLGNAYKREKRISPGVGQRGAHALRRGHIGDRAHWPFRGDPFPGGMGKNGREAKEAAFAVDVRRLDGRDFMPAKACVVAKNSRANSSKPETRFPTSISGAWDPGTLLLSFPW